MTRCFIKQSFRVKMSDWSVLLAQMANVQRRHGRTTESH